MSNTSVQILSQRGIPIARRAVAKYRTELNIPPSNMLAEVMSLRLTLKR